VQLALRTQQIVAHESGVPKTVDPLAGSYYLERLTNEIEARASAYITKLDALGGAVRAIEVGYVQREIQESAYRYQRALESGEETLVGVNAFAEGQEAPPPQTLRVDPQMQERQLARLRQLKARRDNVQVQASLAELKEAARGEANLMYPIIACVKNLATLGEICDVLRQVFGEYQEGAIL
jgi:methylmalonyl-CoA mutase N-terminal domain/subunit